MSKKAYKYNFSNFMGQCELNYMLLCRLLPEMEDEDEFDYLIQEHYRMTIQIIERCRYTTYVRVNIDGDCQSNWLLGVEVDIRLYHDAHLAEVVDRRGMAMQPVNPYPNPDMLQRDEKQGVNNFLGEWLSFCLKHGRSTETIMSGRLEEKKG